ncbi:MAG: phosphate ABC transporter permease PstA [Candidatus Pacebacteria bacterium]|nr:phosphate ABC transporter permease PstA [Candidatus Paceibacterota bacterium]
MTAIITSLTSLYFRRRLFDGLVKIFAWSAVIFAAAVLLFVLGMLFVKGLEGISFQLFTHSTSPAGTKGGLANAMVGSLIITFGAVAIGAPAGILAGTYLAEYGRGKKLSGAIRFANDILLSSPSIIIGLFIYTIAVAPLKHFSAWSGSVALAIITLPVVLRTTEDMLLMVPNALREAAAALGATKWRVIILICYRSARQGIINGMLLAVARISGETAPLIFTSLGNQNWSLDIAAPMAALPIVIYNYARSPYEDQIQLAWSGALLITVAILLLNIVAKMLGGQNRR